MPDSKPYTNREIKEKWDDIANSLSRIEVQTTTTNGRINALEKWKYMGMGATMILTTMILPILVWSLSILVNMETRIQDSVDKALAAYDINK